MTDLATVLARMVLHYFRDPETEPLDKDCMAVSRTLLATPEGHALSALVEAALAESECGHIDCHCRRRLGEAADRYREVTK